MGLSLGVGTLKHDKSNYMRTLEHIMVSTVAQGPIMQRTMKSFRGPSQTCCNKFVFE